MAERSPEAFLWLSDLQGAHGKNLKILFAVKVHADGEAPEPLIPLWSQYEDIRTKREFAFCASSVSQHHPVKLNWCLHYLCEDMYTTVKYLALEFYIIAIAVPYKKSGKSNRSTVFDVLQK